MYCLQEAAVLPFFATQTITGHQGAQKKPVYSDDILLGEAMRGMIRSSYNNRHQADTRQRYSEIILEKGISRGVRSAPVAVLQAPLPDSKVQIYELLAGATLAEAFFAAYDSHGGKDNQNVKDALKYGYPSVTILDSRTPPDVQTWFKDQANEYNLVAAPMSFIEICEVSHSAMQNYKKCQDLGFQTCQKRPSDDGYETSLFEWISSNYKGVFDSFREFDRSHQFHARMQKTGCWDSFKSTAELSCEFSNPAIQPHVVIHNLLAVSRAFDPCIKLDPEGYPLVMMLKVMEFCYPPSVRGASGDVLFAKAVWALKTRQDVTKIKGLMADLTSSKLFKLSRMAQDKKLQSVMNRKRREATVLADAKSSAAGEACEGGEGKNRKESHQQIEDNKENEQPEGNTEHADSSQEANEPKGKTGKSKAKAKAAPKAAKSVLKAEIFDNQIISGKGARKVLLFDDILSAVEFAIEPFQDIIQLKVDGVIMRCLEFGLNAEVTLPALKGKGTADFTAWKNLRKHVKGLLAQWHKQCPRKDDPDMVSDNEGAATASADQSDSIYNLTLKLKDDPKLVGAFVKFLKDNPASSSSTPLRCHEALNSIIRDVLRSVESTRDAMLKDSEAGVIESVLRTIATSLEKHYPYSRFGKTARYLWTAADGLVHDSDAGVGSDPGDVALSLLKEQHPVLATLVDVFDSTLDNVERVMQIRSRYVLATLIEVESFLGSGKPGVTFTNVCGRMKKLEQLAALRFDEIAVGDLEFESAASDWTQYWSGILMNLDPTKSAPMNRRTESELTLLRSMLLGKSKSVSKPNLAKLIRENFELWQSSHQSWNSDNVAASLSSEITTAWEALPQQTLADSLDCKANTRELLQKLLVPLQCFHTFTEDTTH